MTATFRSHVFAATLLLSLLLAPSSAVAQSSTRLHESVIVTASAEPVPFESLARTVVVLTRAEIARLPIRSVDELLRYAASLDVRARGDHGMQADFAVRGANFSQTLVLVDGMRMNDAQSGHHNADVPLTLDDVERVEVLLGPGSSLFGADALGGTINVITREVDRRGEVTASVGEHGLVEGRGRLGVRRGGLQQAVGIAASRSSGFMFDRDFETFAASSRTGFGHGARLLVGHVRKAFGANGFYGPAPSREWTDQTLASFSQDLPIAGWKTTAQAAYRTHGDRFLYDLRQPALSENVHRTHAITGQFRSHRVLAEGRRLSAGLESGGDWIDSSNLGDRSFGRVSGFAELQESIGERVIVYPALRYDTYSSFGSAWSPSLAAVVSVGAQLRVRGSLGRAFRVPTFTELYYRDPNHQANDDLRPERAWGGEVAGDWIVGRSWMARGVFFVRRERDVIDWIRVTSAERWQTTNVRDVATEGVEVGLKRLLGEVGSIEAQYTYLTTDAEALDGFLSKYVLEYAPHSVIVTAMLRLPLAIELGQRVGWTRRNDGRSYTVADLRLARPFGPLRIVADASNLLDTGYEEIKGVRMPGRWLSMGVQVPTF